MEKRGETFQVRLCYPYFFYWPADILGKGIYKHLFSDLNKVRVQPLQTHEG